MRVVNLVWGWGFSRKFSHVCVDKEFVEWCCCYSNSNTLQQISLIRRAIYRKISWNLEAARSDVIKMVSLWNLTAISAALPSRRLSNFRAIGKVWSGHSRPRNFKTSYGKTSVRLVNRGAAADHRVELIWCYVISNCLDRPIDLLGPIILFGALSTHGSRFCILTDLRKPRGIIHHGAF